MENPEPSLPQTEKRIIPTSNTQSEQTKVYPGEEAKTSSEISPVLSQYISDEKLTIKKLGIMIWSVAKKFFSWMGWLFGQIIRLFQKTHAEQKHRKILQRAVIIVIAIFVSFISYLGYQHHLDKQRDNELRNTILEAEAWFNQRNYKEAERLYNEAMTKIQDSSVRSFLNLRKTLVMSLRELEVAIAQGQLANVDELLQRGQKEQWAGAMTAIFLAHCTYFEKPIAKLRQYQKNVQEILELLKQGKQSEAETLLVQSIEMAKKTQKSLIPLRNEMLRGVQDGYPSMLLIAWKYKSALQIQESDFANALGKAREEQRINAIKMIENQPLEIAPILVQLLLPEDRQLLAKTFLSQYNMSTSNDRSIHLTLALTFDPWLEQAHYQLAEYYRSQKKYDEAQFSYQKASVSYQIHILDAIAWCSLEKRDWPNAYHSWKKILEISDTYQPAQLGLVLLLGLCQNFAQSDAHLQKIPHQIQSSYPELLKSSRKGNRINHETILSNHPIFNSYTLLYSTYFQPNDSLEYCMSLITQAERILREQGFSPDEAWLTKIWLMEKNTLNNAEANDTLKRWETSKEPFAQFCYILYFQSKGIPKEELIQSLPESWQNFWKEIQSEKINHSESKIKTIGIEKNQ